MSEIQLVKDISSGRFRKQSLLDTYPHIAEQWCYEKNGDLRPNAFTAGSHKIVWWKCPVGDDHIWCTEIRGRVKGIGCQICNKRKPSKSNCLLESHPHIAKQWDHKKNFEEGVGLDSITSISRKRAHWICKRGHEWEAVVRDRTSKNTRCPSCTGRKPSIENNLSITHPELVRQWHPTKNGKRTPQSVTKGSEIKIWWKCQNFDNHEWETYVYSRTAGRDCPFCGYWSVESIRLFILSLMSYLHTLEPAELYAIFQQNGLLESSGTGQFFVKTFLSGKLPKEDVIGVIDDPQKFADLVESQKSFMTDNHNELRSLSEEEIKSNGNELPIVETKNILASIDSKIIASADVETIDFLIKSAVAKIWRHTFYNEDEAQLQLEQYQEHGEYSRAVKKMFSAGYQGAKELEIPTGYNSNPPSWLPQKDQLGLMQRYVAYQIKTQKKFGNWSGTGSGKTLSAILASRVIDAQFTIIFCPNNVIDTWKNQILASYPDSLILTKESILQFSNNVVKNKYLILNYEFFQQINAESVLKKLIEQCLIDFIVIDEIHQSKQREQGKFSKRKKVIATFLSELNEKNKNLAVLGMSATPVINNLFEGKSLLELITGFYYEDLDTKPTYSNCIALYKQFVSHGIRYIPTYKTRFNERMEWIDCSHSMHEIKNHKSHVELEAILTRVKLPLILDHLEPKTIVYTHYRHGIEIVLQEAISQDGWDVVLFNGDTKIGLEKFINGDADILIATTCIGTGIDGLQKICHKLIINCLPWTHAEYKQLIGRIYRQGQIREKIDVIIPLTYIEINGERWSWCESRWKRIEFKKSIADAAVDGTIPEGHLKSIASAHKEIMGWLNRLTLNGIHEIERSKVVLQLSANTEWVSVRKIGDLSLMNQQINREKSITTHQRFLENPEQWHDYHFTFKEARKVWPVIPNYEALKWCKERPNLIIGDFGCGEALLAQELKNKVYSFDHVAINDQVVACDMARVPLKEAMLDVAIFSLSLMGVNYVDYLKEAKRCLKLDGWLWIAEPTARIKDIEQFKAFLRKLGFYMIDIETKDRFTFIKALNSGRKNNEIMLDQAESVSLLA